MRLVGVDSCPGGWYFVSASPDLTSISGSVHERFDSLLAMVGRESLVAVDIPIGLAESGSRACDQLARRFLAPKRHSSVFPAPIRPVLSAQSHAEASAIRRRIEGKGVSIQAFSITRKIREVDHTLTNRPEVSRQVYEIHPEVSFAAMNGGRPMSVRKSKLAGRAERLQLLSTTFGEQPGRLVAERPKQTVNADDVVDAFAALWTAARIAQGLATSLPPQPPADTRGLRMSIVY